MRGPHVVFLVNLLQDVNILRPLVQLVATEFTADIRLLVSEKFADRDTQGLWQAELSELCAETGASSSTFGSEWDALRLLPASGGLLVAASESSLAAHATTHNVLRVAPRSFLCVTLQHGFECVGFHHNRDHDRAHGRNVTFAADVVCGWCELPWMESVAASERSKYLATGPTSLLQAPAPSSSCTAIGLVCENLHSVRLRTSGDFRTPFIDTFSAFCGELGRRGQRVALRPHPGGQYMLKNNVALPANVDLENGPMYKIDLGRFAYGISAPSSVLVDMVLAGLPTAVWQDEDGVMDASHYEGLTVVSSLEEWLAFERDAQVRPEVLLQQQRRFVERSGLITDRQTVHRRFAQLVAAALDVATTL